MFKLKKLPYEINSLEPFISQKTLEFHWGKHHRGYIEKLNLLIKGNKKYKNISLKDLIIKEKNGIIFNNAAQSWNHEFYWKSLNPHNKYSKKKSSDFIKIIENTFKSLNKFKKQFISSGLQLFGSGWLWLVKNYKNELSILNTYNAGNPLTKNLKPIIVCDIWEHSYYIDVYNNRAKYLENFWKLINWNFASNNYFN